MTDKPTISFGFKNKIERKVDKTKVIQETTDDIKHEFFNKVDEATFNQKPLRKKELIIPLIQKNRYNNQAKGHESQNDNKDEAENLEDKAAREIVHESEAFLNQKSSKDHDKEFENLAVPLLLKNKVPDGFETNDKLNVSLRPEGASKEDYDGIPVEAFGMAMLRGMGWDPKVGIGKTFKEDYKMLEATVRPKGLGLGASVPKTEKKNRQNNDTNATETEFLELKEGSFVIVQSGNHKRKYGIVQGIDADNAQCFVKFALGNVTATVGQYCLKPVAKSEYKQFSKDLSRLSKAYADTERQKKLAGHNIIENNVSSSKNPEDSPSRSEQHSSKHSKHKRKRQHKEICEDPDNHVSRDLPNLHKHKKNKTKEQRSESNKRYNMDSHEMPGKMKKRLNSGSDNDFKSHGKSSQKKPRRTWLRPNLCVRMVDAKYRKGKYYREKLIVIDVLDSRGHCCCKIGENTLLDDIHEDMLETVVPRSSSNAYVLITSKGKSKHEGKLARIIEKDKEECEAYLQLIEDRDVALRVSFDDICEYVGDIEAEHLF